MAASRKIPSSRLQAILDKTRHAKIDQGILYTRQRRTDPWKAHGRVSEDVCLLRDAFGALTWDR